MKIIENECVGCPKEMGCMGSACQYYAVERYVCDCCGAEDVTLYRYDGEEICEECLLSKFEIVDGSDM